ncbi:general secretion pathway protein D [Desulforhopalus singaporensis]|uniref:General secretion pathway protein D n=2 Tax=Desulforhopalus singaporensis TaxID=91360 RepID=A0A1H0SES9_9BACT|nr:general secretion pathway protein D [Desulforhopalus singaporensis]
MMAIKKAFLSGSLLLLSLSIASCFSDPQQHGSAPSQETMKPAESVVEAPPKPATLPVTYQMASYVVDRTGEEDISIAAESVLKVGARITSTQGPQPLWDIVKRLVALKGMNVSWASDVDRNVLVDVDINADDDFYQALDNMLRQVDYFHEVHGKTLVIKYRETRSFQIAMPFTKQNYTTEVGGNVLGGGDTSNDIGGTIQLDSKDNKFDIWENIETNLQTVFNIYTSTKAEQAVRAAADMKADAKADPSEDSNVTATPTPPRGATGFYLIDKPVGIITVTAPRPMLEKIEDYFATLKKALYRQISIEAKIIEVQLSDASSIGINWSNVLKDFSINGAVQFGANGQVYPFVYNNPEVNGSRTYLGEDQGSFFKTIDPGQFVSKISLSPANFNVLLNALKEEGDTRILSNPKLSVMNGQPALITVGKNVTYIDEIKSDSETDSDIITFTVETERILSGIGMSLTATILGNDEIIMNLVPITSELEPIEYIDVGNLGGKVGLPVVNVREMSTTVKVRDGEMLVIGGLISNVDQKNGEFAPILGDIPLLRYLFGYEEKQTLKRELIILLRPRII